MARIVGGIGASHSPTIGFAKDTGKQNDPGWKPIFDGFDAIRHWVHEKKIDVIFMVYNDHITSFFLDHYSAFVLGIDDRYEAADEGGGPRQVAPAIGHLGLSHHLAMSLVADEFDMSFFQGKPVDHGFLSPLSMLGDERGPWPGQVVPLQVGVLQLPVPSARRMWKLGQALRRAVESYPEALNVAIMATGGLSHQVHGERAGFLNEAWDHEFLDLLQNAPEQLVNMRVADYALKGGMEGAEVTMWLIMRGALSKQVRLVHRQTYAPSMTNIATLVFDDLGGAPDPSMVAAHRQHMRHELEGAAALASEHGLSDEEKALIRGRKWIEMVRRGVIFFVLEKMAAVLGVSNPEVYAAFRGETLEEFQASRKVAMRYSVAGGDRVRAMDKA